MGAEGQDVERRLDVSKRNRIAPTERQSEEEPLVCPKVGVRKRTEGGPCQSKVSGTTSLPMALWEFRAGGKRVWMVSGAS